MAHDRHVHRRALAEPHDLAPVDAFHIGGRQATIDFAGKLGVTRGMHLLDIGSGLGGASRHLCMRSAAGSRALSLTPGLTKNADGSVDVYFGPKAPTGKESNWVPTKSGGRFEVMFRFYGPEKPLFDKTWQLPDIAKAS